MMIVSLIFVFVSASLVVIGGIVKAHDLAKKEQLEKIDEITKEFNRRNKEIFDKMADDMISAQHRRPYDSSGAVNADFEILNNLPAVRKN